MLLRNDPWTLLNELSCLFEKTHNKSLDDSHVESSRWIPAVDIKEENDQFKLYVDIPGVNLNNINVSMENNILTIKGFREELQREDKNSYYRIERTKGTFYRRFALPDTADADNIEASVKQGVLQVTVGKKKIALSRNIEVKTED